MYGMEALINELSLLIERLLQSLNPRLFCIHGRSFPSVLYSSVTVTQATGNDDRSDSYIRIHGTFGIENINIYSVSR